MKNEHATAVIDAYLDADVHPVAHAILVEGPWGSGKTYFLEKIYEPDRQAKAKASGFYKTPFLFVSLFGVKTADDVEKRMHRAASPGEVAVGRTLGTIVSGGLEFLKIKDAKQTAFDAIEKRAARRHVDYILVFDDLERVETGALGEIMGLVNSLITMGQRRVILVGDEAKLLVIHKDANWDEQNEKIVGRRARIEADVESVVRRSVEEISDGPTKSFMKERVDLLTDLANRSQVENLRNLSWAMVNGARFVRSLLMDAEIREGHTDHVARTMLVVVATTLWYRSKKLSNGALGRLPSLSLTLAVRSMGDMKRVRKRIRRPLSQNSSRESSPIWPSSHRHWNINASSISKAAASWTTLSSRRGPSLSLASAKDSRNALGGGCGTATRDQWLTLTKPQRNSRRSLLRGPIRNGGRSFMPPVWPSNTARRGTFV
jgi:hypothetical protein